MELTIREQLTKYMPCNEQEMEDKAKILALLQDDDVFYRHHEPAHVTVSAWVINEEGTKTLMVYHNIYQSWSWLGGHADGEQNLLAVAIKEVKEESGLEHVWPVTDEIFSIEILTVDGHEKNGNYVSSHLHLNVTYLLQASEQDNLRIKEDENSGVQWFLFEDAVMASTESWFQERIYPKLIQKLSEEKRKYFRVSPIPDEIFERIKGLSFGKNCTVPREDLRYMTVLHMGFDGKTHVGEMICHKEVAGDFIDVLYQLYIHKYPIEKMLLIDVYGADDEKSMADNNSSSFNFRVIAGTNRISQHGYGKAIDINPLYNPYVLEDGSFTPLNASDYTDRSKPFLYKIDENDLCYRLFHEKGYDWGGHWGAVRDYQHFQKEKRKLS